MTNTASSAFPEVGFRDPVARLDRFDGGEVVVEQCDDREEKQGPREDATDQAQPEANPAQDFDDQGCDDDLAGGSRLEERPDVHGATISDVQHRREVRGLHHAESDGYRDPSEDCGDAAGGRDVRGETCGEIVELTRRTAGGFVGGDRFKDESVDDRRGRSGR